MLSNLLRNQGKSDEALPLIRSLHGDRHPRTLQALSALAGQLHGEGKADQAEPLAREAVATSNSLLGASHPFALVARVQLAAILRGIGGAANEAEADAIQGITPRVGESLSETREAVQRYFALEEQDLVVHRAASQQ